MSIVKVFDPAMCCSSGVCGTDVDPVLVETASVLKELSAQGITVERYNLSQDLQAYAKEEAVANLLKSEGPGVLPITMVDGDVVAKGAYLSADALRSFFVEDCCGSAGGCCTPAPASSGCCSSEPTPTSGGCCSSEPATSSCCSDDSDCCSDDEVKPMGLDSCGDLGGGCC